MFVPDALPVFVAERVGFYGRFRLDVSDRRQFVFYLFSRVDRLEPDPMFVGDLDHFPEVLGNALHVLIGWVGAPFIVLP